MSTNLRTKTLTLFRNIYTHKFPSNNIDIKNYLNSLIVILYGFIDLFLIDNGFNNILKIYKKINKHTTIINQQFIFKILITYFKDLNILLHIATDLISLNHDNKYYNEYQFIISYVTLLLKCPPINNKQSLEICFNNLLTVFINGIHLYKQNKKIYNLYKSKYDIKYLAIPLNILLKNLNKFISSINKINIKPFKPINTIIKKIRNKKGQIKQNLYNINDTSKIIPIKNKLNHIYPYLRDNDKKQFIPYLKKIDKLIDYSTDLKYKFNDKYINSFYLTN